MRIGRRELRRLTMRRSTGGMESELNAFISQLMFKLKRPTSSIRAGWSLYFLPLLSKFHPPDKKDVCNNALNVHNSCEHHRKYVLMNSSM
jgi:hypothetical protein